MNKKRCPHLNSIFISGCFSTLDTVLSTKGGYSSKGCLLALHGHKGPISVVSCFLPVKIPLRKRCKRCPPKAPCVFYFRVAGCFFPEQDTASILGRTCCQCVNVHDCLWGISALEFSILSAHFSVQALSFSCALTQLIVV